MPVSEGEARLALPASGTAPRQARRFVHDRLTAWGLAALVDDANLVVTELVTNAVLHTGTAPSVGLRQVGPDQVRVEVLDGSPAPPRSRAFGGTSTTGRGLRLVASLAVSWGIEAQDAGKRVWVVLRVGHLAKPF